jgi:hypothetical protein
MSVFTVYFYIDTVQAQIYSVEKGSRWIPVQNYTIYEHISSVYRSMYSIIHIL